MQISQTKTSRKLLILFVLLVFLSNIFGMTGASAYSYTTIGVQPFDDVRSRDLSSMDFRGNVDLLFTLTFDTYTKWPSKDKMPEAFDPARLLEEGKKPGLGVEALHQQGYTGKGVAIAYVDQHLLPNHEAYSNVILSNQTIQDENFQPSMHGPAVLSLLAGKDSGIVPNAEVYYFGHSGMKDDNEYEARAFEKIIELNKMLPDNKRIKIIGMSHCADDSLDVTNAEHLRRAQAAARRSGIIVVDVTCGMATCGVQGFKDRNDYRNYQLSHWEEKSNPAMFQGQLLVPADFRTTAVGYRNDPSHFAYWGEGGFSWGVPYITGVITMGLQIDPTLTEAEAFQFLHKSAHKHLNGDLINPEGFIKLVKENHTRKSNGNYYYVLYNSKKISINDQIALTSYSERLTAANNFCILKDVAEYSTAVDIYKALKSDSTKYSGKLLGIQIIGSYSDVPAFDIHYKVQMKSSIDEGGYFKSDHFYGSFASDAGALEKDFSIFKAFDEKLNISFVPEWSVSRLPLGAGEIGPFINKYYDYKQKLKGIHTPYINFSNPIFPQPVHSDDMGYFIQQRLDQEFHLLSSSDYRLYGNKEGLYPVTTNVLGGFEQSLLKQENQKGIAHFIINSHGQNDNIDNCFHIAPKDSEKYKDTARSIEPFNGDSQLLEVRIPFLNRSNINELLRDNYYTLTLWTCLNAANLGSDTLVHEALAKGMAIDAMAASSTISNNGVHNDVSLEEFKKNNFYYFMYEFFHSQSKGVSRNESFFEAKKHYASEILKHTDMLLDGNYGFNLHNVLSYHYLGLIDIPEKNNIGTIDFLDKDVLPADTKSSTPRKHITIGSIDGTYYPLDNLFSSSGSGSGYLVHEVGYCTDDSNVYIKIRYSSDSAEPVCVFLQGDAPGLKELLTKGTKAGSNEITLTFTKKELVDFPVGIAVNIGNRNFIFIQKSTLDAVAKSSGITHKLKKLIVNKSSLTLDVGDSHKLSVKGLYEDGAEADFTNSVQWSSDKPDVAVMKNDQIIAKASGTATITLQFEGHIQQVKVLVSKNTSDALKVNQGLQSSVRSDDKQSNGSQIKKKFVRLVLSSKTLFLVKGKTVQVKVFAVTANGTQVDVTNKATWKVSNPRVATNKGGYVKAVGTGKCTLTVKYQGITMELAVNVR